MGGDFVNGIVEKVAQNVRQKQSRPPARQSQQQSQKQPSQQRGSQGGSSPEKQVMSMAKKLANMPPKKRFAAIKKGLKKNPQLAKKVIKVLKKKGVAVKPGEAQSQQTQKQQGKPQKKPVQTGDEPKQKVMFMAKKLSKMPPRKRRSAIKKGLKQDPAMAKKVIKILKKKGVPLKLGQQNGQKGSGGVDPKKMLSTMVNFMKSEKGQKLIGQIASSQIDDVKKDIEEKKQKLKKLTDSKAKLRLLAEELLKEKKNNNNDDEQETRKAKTNATPDEVSNKLSDELSSKFKTAAQNSEGVPSIEEIEQALLATEGPDALLTPEKSLENPKKTATYAGVSKAFEKTSQDSDALPMLAGAGLGTVGGMYAANQGLFENQTPANANFGGSLASNTDERLIDLPDGVSLDSDDAASRSERVVGDAGESLEMKNIGTVTRRDGTLPELTVVDEGDTPRTTGSAKNVFPGAKIRGFNQHGNIVFEHPEKGRQALPRERATLYDDDLGSRVELKPVSSNTVKYKGPYPEAAQVTAQSKIPDSTARSVDRSRGYYTNKFSPTFGQRMDDIWSGLKNLWKRT